MKQVSLSIILLFLLCKISIAQPFGHAQWITTSAAEPIKARPALIFKKDFRIKAALKSASLYITAHGLYEASLNGKRIGDGYFTPGYTEYQKRLQYQVYELKTVEGNNQLQVTLGEGYYRGDYGRGPNFYGQDGSILVQLELVYLDGKKEIICSDNSWLSTTGPILMSSIYNGELYDSNRQPENWQPVKTLDLTKVYLVPTLGSPVKKHEVFYVKKTIGLPSS